jgi:hypothetical protein
MRPKYGRFAKFKKTTRLVDASGKSPKQDKRCPTDVVTTTESITDKISTSDDIPFDSSKALNKDIVPVDREVSG